MTFKQMFSTLLELGIPYDAEVIIVNDFNGDRHDLEMLEYDPQKRILYLKGSWTSWYKWGMRDK